MKASSNDNPDARGMRVAVVVSDYHADVTHAMRDAALELFTASGGAAGDIHVIVAPGAFELALLALACARRDDIDAVVTLGCILTGETTHDRHLAAALAQGLTNVMLETGKAVAFGVLTCQTIQQARARAGGSVGNKGEEAMAAAIHATAALRTIGAGSA
ncbi:MAG: 6,7-dimethyl-8-ribityllumazine synthase [Planctomycetota bacterium]|jgi:6,7-dimethyl-8-ribityllumazine synthase